MCWGADLVCTGGLEQAWRVLAAVRAAREASGRAVRLAAGGSALGALLVVTGRRATAPLNLAPMHSAALIALLGGVVSARRLAARPAPQPLPRIPWHALDPRAAAEQAVRLRTAPPARRPARRRPPIPVPLPGGAGRRAGLLADVARAVGHELRDPLTPVLVLGAAASAVVGSGVDAGLVGGVMAGNALISGVQRARAERALRELLLDQRPPSAGSARTATGGRGTTRGCGAASRCRPTACRRPSCVRATSSRSAPPTWCPRTPGCWPPTTWRSTRPA
ncbi:hypothetical protein [Actinomadura keratinilytica]|uniref:hypothetical protein n=1 Tax=Actinomadura keratinilytica TaxID=547461 RepID=UPI00361BD156